MKIIFLFISFIFTTHFSVGQLNKFLVAELDSIYTDDQKYRVQVDSIMEKYGWESE